MMSESVHKEHHTTHEDRVLCTLWSAQLFMPRSERIYPISPQMFVSSRKQIPSFGRGDYWCNLGLNPAWCWAFLLNSSWCFAASFQSILSIPLSHIHGPQTLHFLWTWMHWDTSSLCPGWCCGAAFLWASSHFCERYYPASQWDYQG